MRAQLGGDPQEGLATLGFPARNRAPDEAEDLRAVPPRQQLVALRPGLGAFLDEIEHLFEERVVEVGVDSRGAVLPVGVEHPVVAGVVGEHRDGRRREVRGHQERVVLEPPRTLGEADPRVEQELPAEHLVRREQAPQRTPGEVDLRPVLGEQRRRQRAAADSHLASDDHVGAVLAAVVRHPLERLGPEEVVVVNEVDVVAAREVETDVAWLSGPPRRSHVRGTHVGTHLGDPVHEALGAVGGAVVDEDDLELPGRQALPVEGADETREVAAGVERGDDHSCPWTGSGHPRTVGGEGRTPGVRPVTGGCWASKAQDGRMPT